MQMLSLDTIIISITGISAIIGWCRGCIKEILTLVAWGASAFLAIVLFPFGKTIVANFINQPLLVDLVTYIFIFVIFLLVLSLVTYFFSELVKHTILNIPNKIFGGIFGIIRGLIILSILDFGLTQYCFNDLPTYFKNSILRPYVQSTAQMVFVILPSNTQKTLIKHISADKQKAFLGSSAIESLPELKSVIAKHAEVKVQEDKGKDDKGKKNENDAKSLAQLNVKKPNLTQEQIFSKTKKDLDKLLEQFS